MILRHVALNNDTFSMETFTHPQHTMYKILQLGDEFQVVFDGNQYYPTDKHNSKMREKKTLGAMSEIQMETSNIAASLIESVNKATFDNQWRLTKHSPQHTRDDEWSKRPLTAGANHWETANPPLPRARGASAFREKLASVEWKMVEVERRLKEAEEERNALKREVSALNDQMTIAREAYNKLLTHEANKWALIKAEIKKTHYAAQINEEGKSGWESEVPTTISSNPSFN